MVGNTSIARFAMIGMGMLLPLAATTAHAGSVTLTPTKDASLIQTSDGSLADGGSTSFYSGETGRAGARRGLLAFDVADNVPADATITSASLTLTVTKSGPGLINEQYSIYDLLADWGEGSSVSTGGAGAAATPGSATWLYRSYSGTSWTNPGGDFTGNASATQLIGGSGAFTLSSPDVAADVQNWLNNPSSNFGWILIGNESVSDSAKQFASRESTLGAPQLAITYTESATPEPGSAAIAGVVASLALLRRRVRRSC